MSLKYIIGEVLSDLFVSDKNLSLGKILEEKEQKEWEDFKALWKNTFGDDYIE